MKAIPLTKGYFAIVDNDDYESLSNYNWHAYKQGKYAATNVYRDDGKRTVLFMHRLILGITDPKIDCDHIDGNGLNNARDNLRACTRSENLRNRGKQANNTSGFKGVNLHKSSGRWRACIKVNNKSFHLGFFDSPEDAFEGYKKAALELHGEFAKY